PDAPAVGQEHDTHPDRYHVAGSLDGWAIWYSYPAMKIAQIAADATRANGPTSPVDTAHPVPITITVAATSPARMRLTFPSFAACSWKNGEATVNHDGQKPANTPDASPISRIRIVAFVVLIPAA